MPMIVETWPGAMKPSSSRSSISARKSIAGGISLWLTRKLKLSGARGTSTAFIGVVVSNPMAKKTNCLPGSFLAMAAASLTL